MAQVVNMIDSSTGYAVKKKLNTQRQVDIRLRDLVDRFLAIDACIA